MVASAERPLIFDIQKFSVHDGPGIRTVVFFKGCPLRCRWCANPESHKYAPELMFYPDKCIGCGVCIKACPNGCIGVDHKTGMFFDRDRCTDCCVCTEECYSGARRKSGDEMSLDDIKKEVDKDMVFYETSGGGITFSGGEAMCFPETVRELAEYYKGKKVTTALETCGYVPWESYEMVIPYMDLVMFDLKVMDDAKHREYTGGSNRLILDNIKKLYKRVNTVVRIPIIPGVNDSEKDIDEFGRFVSTMKDGINTVHILPYHDLGLSKYNALGREYLMEDTKAPSDERMAEIKKHLEGFGFNVVTGG